MVEDASRADEIEDIGPYQIIRRLGQGGMADVYVGRHRLIGRTVAIKVLLEEHARDASMRARFLNEARAVASIQHPSVVLLYEIGQTDRGDAYLAMELLEGETLSARMRREGTMAAAEAVGIAREIAGALIAAHDRSVIHRDLKPSNVMLVPDLAGRERVKVLDFGIAKVFEAPGSISGDLTRTGALVGTPTYMSPEQCRGTGEVDHRTDIYSLGVVLYRMITGRPPFRSRGAGEVIGMHLYLPPQPPRSLVPDLPLELDRFILRCLEKDPADRFQSMDEVVTALEEIVDTVEATPRAERRAASLPELPTSVGTGPSGASHVRELGLRAAPGSDEAPAWYRRRLLLVGLLLAGGVGGAIGAYVATGSDASEPAALEASEPAPEMPASVGAGLEPEPVIVPFPAPAEPDPVLMPLAAMDELEASGGADAGVDAVPEPEPAAVKPLRRPRKSTAKPSPPRPTRPTPAPTTKPPKDDDEDERERHDFEKPVF